MIDLNEVLIAAKEEDHMAVIDLYDISLRSGMVYVSNTNKDLEFEGKKYVSMPIEREEIKQSTDNIDDSMKITMADGTMEQLQYIIAGFEFRGCTVRVRQILYPESIKDNSIYRETFYGYIDNPAYENGEFSCTLRSRLHKITVPRRTYQGMCNSRFGDEICQMELGEHVGRIVEVLGSNRIAIDVTKGDEYWNNGVITIAGESRMIQRTKGNKVTTFYPFFATIEAGQTYSIRRGCDKTKTNCARYNNLEHYTGFPSIPFEDVYR